MMRSRGIGAPAALPGAGAPPGPFHGTCGPLAVRLARSPLPHCDTASGVAQDRHRAAQAPWRLIACASAPSPAQSTLESSTASSSSATSTDAQPQGRAQQRARSQAGGSDQQPRGPTSSSSSSAPQQRPASRAARDTPADVDSAAAGRQQRPSRRAAERGPAAGAATGAAAQAAARQRGPSSSSATRSSTTRTTPSEPPSSTSGQRSGTSGASTSKPRPAANAASARASSSTGSTRPPTAATSAPVTPRRAGALAATAVVAAAAAATSASKQEPPPPQQQPPGSSAARAPAEAAVLESPRGAADDAALLQADRAFLEALRARAAELANPELGAVQQHLQQLVQAALAPPDAGAAAASEAAGYRSRLYRLVLGDVAAGEAGVNRHDDDGDDDGVAQPAAAAGEGSGAKQQQQEEEDGEEEGEEAAPGPGSEGYVPEVEVVNDVVDALMGIKLPPKAFYGARARALAALPLDQAKAQCRLWMDVCGPNFARMFVAKEPRLLVTQPVDLLKTLQAVSGALGLKAPEAVQWATRNGSLLVAGLTQERLEGSVREVAEVLGLEQAAAQAVARRHTMLLTFAPGDVRKRAEVLAALLPVQRGKLMKALSKRPTLLTRSPQSLATSLACLAALLELPLDQAALAVVAEPGLTGVAAGRAAARWHRLKRLAKRHAPWWAQLGSMGAPQLARCLTVPEASVSRLAFVLNSRLQDFDAAADLKKLLTMSNTSFRAQLMAEAWSRQQDKRGGKPPLPPPQQRQPRGGEALPAPKAIQPAPLPPGLPKPVVPVVGGAHAAFKVTEWAGVPEWGAGGGEPGGGAKGTTAAAAAAAAAGGGAAP